MAIENIGLYPISIDVYKKHKESTIYANDNDVNGRGLLITLLKNNTAFDSTGINLKIGFRNAVGEERLYDCELVDATQGQYKVFYPTEMLEGNGGRVVKLEIKAFEASGALLNYAPVFVYVSASEIPNDSIGGGNELSTLVNALSQVQGIDNRFGEVNAQLAENTQDYLSLGKTAEGGTSDKDNLNLLSALVTKAKSSGKGLYVPHGKYYCSDNLVIQGLNSIRIDGEIVLPNGKVLEITNDARSIEPCNWFINKISGKIRVSGLKNAKVEVVSAEELELYAHGDIPEKYSLAYSTFHLGNIEKFRIFSEGTNGWINENTFYGGRFKDIFIGGTYAHNKNIFYSPTIEGTIVTIERGYSNYFYDCRFESTNTVSFGEGTFDNVLFRSWQVGMGVYLRDTNNIPYTNSGYNNYVLNTADTFHKKEVIYKLTSKSNNFNLAKFIRNDLDLTTKSGAGIVFETDLIKVDNPFGIIIEANVSSFRPSLYVYDANKQPILSEPTNFTSVVGATFNTLEGRYVFGANQKKIGFPIHQHSEVKYVKILISLTSFTGSLDFLKVTKIEEESKDTTIDNIINNKLNHNVSPTEGTWNVGDIVWNNVPSAGAYLGWVCVSAGTPGTWKGFGTIES